MPAIPAPRISTLLPAGGRDSLIGPSKLEPSAYPSSVMAWYMAALPATTPIIWNRERRLGAVMASALRWKRQAPGTMRQAIS